MTKPQRPVLPPWLKYLAIFALCNLVCAMTVLSIGHAVFGAMRPLNGVFILGALALALIVGALIAARYAWIVASGRDDGSAAP